MAYYILYNPIAGSGNAQTEIEALSAFCGGEPICMDITKIESYADFFAPLSESDAIVLCGGDGTLNRFINDTDGIEIACEIYYHALGSGNDFLRDVGRTVNDGPFSIKELIRDLPIVEVKGKTYRFLDNVGFGIDGYCCVEGARQKLTAKKAVNYTAIAITGLLFHYKPSGATVTVDGKEYRYDKRVWTAPTMKGRYYGGGMMAAPKQDRRAPDGKLSVLVFHGGGRIRTLLAFPSIFKGEHVKHKSMVEIHEGQTIHVKFDAPSIIQIDGETITDVTEYTAYARVPAKV